MWQELGITPPVEPLLPDRPPPWANSDAVRISLEAGALLNPRAADSVKREAALHHLASLPQCATWVSSDGSATGGVTNGGAGALTIYPNDDHQKLRQSAGALCSSFRAEMAALRAALDHLLDHPRDTEEPIIICTDSRATLAALREGPAAQHTLQGAEVWRRLLTISDADRPVTLQGVPEHCSIPGNDAADVLAKEAAALAQEPALLDATTIYRAAARLARERAAASRPAYTGSARSATDWYRELMGTKYPPPIAGIDRATAVDVHQMRTGRWSGSV